MKKNKEFDKAIKDLVRSELRQKKDQAYNSRKPNPKSKIKIKEEYYAFSKCYNF